VVVSGTGLFLGATVVVGDAVLVGDVVLIGDVVLAGGAESVTDVGGAPATSPSHPVTSATRIAPNPINAYLVRVIFFPPPYFARFRGRYGRKDVRSGL
jgi:hypothetical protein